MAISIAIWGAGQHAKTSVDVAKAAERYDIAGFIDDIRTQSHGGTFCERPVLGGAEVLETLKASGIQGVFVAIGQNEARLARYRILAERELASVTLIHPSASIAADCQLGDGSIVRAGVVIEADNRLGEAVIVGANCSFGHGCRIADGARISLGSTITGNVHVEALARIGPGCTVLNGVTVGEGALLGAGSVLLEDLPPRKVAVGNPARVIRDVNDADL